MNEKELLKQFAAFIQEHESEDDPKVKKLKASLRKKLGNFPDRFAAGAQEVTKSPESIGA